MIFPNLLSERSVCAQRRAVIWAAVAGLVCAPALNATQDQPAEWRVAIRHLAGNVHLITASNQQSIVNMAASIGEDGVLLSDTGLIGFAPQVEEELGRLAGSDPLVRYIINTHYHSDHVEGNQLFAPGPAVIAHRNTRRSLLEGRAPEPSEPLVGEQLPVLNVGDSLSLFFNGEEIQVIHYATAHTDGDLVVHFTGSDVIHVGDLVLAPDALPYASDVEGLVAALRLLADRGGVDTRFIVGHGEVATRADIEALVGIIESTTDYALAGVRAGKPLETLLAEAPAEWKSWDSQYLSMERWLTYLVSLAQEQEAASGASEASFLAVVNRSGHEVAIVDPATWNVVGRLPTGKGPHELAVSPDGSRAFVPNFGTYPAPHEGPIDPSQFRFVRGTGSTMTVLDPKNNEVIDTFDLRDCTNPHGARVSEDGSRIWVTCEDILALRELDSSTGETTNQWNTEQTGSHMVLSTADGTKLYVANVGSGSVSSIDRRTNEVTTIKTGAGTEGMALSPDGTELWVSNTRANTINVIDVATDRVVAGFESGGAFPVKLSFTPDGQEIWVVNNNSSSLSVYQASDRSLIATIPLGSSPLGLLVSPDGQRVLVTLPRRNEIRVFDTGSREVVSTFSPGIEPDGLAWVP